MSVEFKRQRVCLSKLNARVHMHELPVFEQIGKLVEKPWFQRVTVGDTGAAPLARSPLAAAAQHAFYRSILDMSVEAISVVEPEFEECMSFDTFDDQNKDNLTTIFRAARMAICDLQRRERAAAAFVRVEEEVENDDAKAIFSELCDFALILAPYLTENKTQHSAVEARLIEIAENVEREFSRN